MNQLREERRKKKGIPLALPLVMILILGFAAGFWLFCKLGTEQGAALETSLLQLEEESLQAVFSTLFIEELQLLFLFAVSGFSILSPAVVPICSLYRGVCSGFSAAYLIFLAELHPICTALLCSILPFALIIPFCASFGSASIHFSLEIIKRLRGEKQGNEPFAQLLLPFMIKWCICLAILAFFTFLLANLIVLFV